ncbi:hypothetical protein ACIQUL_36110 [Streptomyces sp. NPDC090303]|uniref:hypothetical protein n=1 Tax=Streptomyces sp. NPDC090303 TaxID=3365960 RepID=UPI0037F210BF
MHIPFLSGWIYDRRVRHAALASLVLSETQTHEKLNALREALHVRDPRRELLVVAAMRVVDAFDDSRLALDVGPSLSEDEAGVLAELLHAAGRHRGAETWEIASKAGEEEPPEGDQARVEADFQLYLNTGNPLIKHA